MVFERKERMKLIDRIRDRKSPKEAAAVAFGELVERFQEMAFQCAYSILRDAHLAEDVVQDAFLEAWRHLPQLEKGEAFPGWLRRIVVSQCYRQLRKPCLETVEIEAAHSISDLKPRPDVEVEAQELKERIFGAISRLPADERVAVTLYHLSGHSYRQIAAYTHVPQTTVEYRLRNARQRLKHLISQETPIRRPMMSTINERMIDAIERGDPERLRKLIDLGADVYAIQSFHPHANPPYAWYPPLFVAIQYGQPKCTEILIYLGAYTRVCNWDGLKDAETLGHEDIVEMIRSRREKESVLITAICEGQRQKAMQLLEADPTLVHANENWHGGERTPLMYATERGDVELVKLIIQKGANIFAEAHATSITAMTVAIHHQHEEIIRLLEAYGAESNDVTNFLYAAQMGNLQCVKELLGKGVDVNAKDECLRHVLPQAFMSGNYELIDFLYERGADPNQSHGWEDYMWLEWHVRKGDEKAV